MNRTSKRWNHRDLRLRDDGTLSSNSSLNGRIACREEGPLGFPAQRTARYRVPPPGSSLGVEVPSRASGEGTKVGGEEKAVSSNPGTRGGAERDAFLSTKLFSRGGERGKGVARWFRVGVV